MENAIVENKEIREMIYIIRGQQVMLDSDLAQLYGYEVKSLNQQVKRNIERFPEDFMFQLIDSEVKHLVRSQFVTSPNNSLFRGQDGGRRYLPYVFTEQGIYMLATVLKGKVAVNQSILIMRTFKELKHYIKENQSLLNGNELLMLSNAVSQNKNDIIDMKENMATKADINKIMDNFIEEDKIKDITILNGQKFEANEAYMSIYKQAKKSIYLIDDYINIDTLSLLKSKHKQVDVIIFSDNKGKGIHHLHELEINNFNEQYPSLALQKNGICHDRYIILDFDTDNEMIYHCGASSKDAGKKVCGINQIKDTEILHSMMNKLLLNGQD